MKTISEGSCDWMWNLGSHTFKRSSNTAKKCVGQIQNLRLEIQSHSYCIPIPMTGNRPRKFAQQWYITVHSVITLELITHLFLPQILEQQTQLGTSEKVARENAFGPTLKKPAPCWASHTARLIYTRQYKRLNFKKAREMARSNGETAQRSFY